MVAPRRTATPDAEKRRALVDAAAALLVEQGSGAVTARAVAARAGLKHQLVHYYFASMDELLIAVVHQVGEDSVDALEAALADTATLREFWEVNLGLARTAERLELSALAKNRPAVRPQIAQGAERLRRRQLAALERVYDRSGIDRDRWPPLGLLVALSGLTQVLCSEEAVGVTLGHDRLRELVEDLFERLAGVRSGRA